MLRFSRRQLDGFKEAMTEKFVTSMVDYLSESYPDELGDVGDLELTQRVRHIMRMAPARCWENARVMCVYIETISLEESVNDSY